MCRAVGPIGQCAVGELIDGVKGSVLAVSAIGATFSSSRAETLA
jgi:hypothetical protein